MEISGQDTAAELAALKATAKAQEAKSKAQDAKIKALSAQLRGNTSGAKRARSCNPVDKKPIPVCASFDSCISVLNGDHVLLGLRT